MKRNWSVAIAAGLVMGVAALSACEESVGEENYDKITVGMTLDQVQAFMGEGEQEVSAGSTISSAGVMGGTNDAQAKKKTYTWKDGNKIIVVDTLDGKVVNKTKRGF